MLRRGNGDQLILIELFGVNAASLDRQGDKAISTSPARIC